MKSFNENNKSAINKESSNSLNTSKLNNSFQHPIEHLPDYVGKIKRNNFTIDMNNMNAKYKSKGIVSSKNIKANNNSFSNIKEEIEEHHDSDLCQKGSLKVAYSTTDFCKKRRIQNLESILTKKQFEGINGIGKFLSADYADVKCFCKICNKEGLSDMDIIYSKDILYTTEYIVDIIKELIATQVSFSDFYHLIK